MKIIKGLLVFFGFIAALCLLVIGVEEVRYGGEHTSRMTAYFIAGTGLGLLYVLYRFGNSN